jgi:N-dimethylarginine dimethylaminohydrolase
MDMRNNWGTRYLMCPPDHFTVSYTINPWMTPTEQVDQPLAQKQ